MSKISRETLDEIRDCDPDAIPEKPIKYDYINFRNWVCINYGVEVWEKYQATDWSSDDDK